MHWYRVDVVGFLLTVGGVSVMSAQGRPDPAVLQAAQREAMQPLAFMDGVWRGEAWTLDRSGTKHTLTQTERIGPFLDAAVKVVEGRGYTAEGTLAFNAFAIISFDPATKAYTMHSYAQGSVGDFVVVPGPDGFTWEIPAGPMTIRYEATIKDGHWREVGDRIMPGRDPMRFYEANLVRSGDSEWPAAGVIGPK